MTDKSGGGGDSNSSSSSSSYSNSSNESIRTESLWVLYGTQTGNSEQAAEHFCQKIKATFTPEFFAGLELEPVTVEPCCIQLDDFLEDEHAAFKKTMVIFVSSYGMGQAPLGSRKFRCFAEEMLIQANSGKISKTLLKGLRYALCGLGNSNYTTYQDNPTTIADALESVGAKPLIAMGEADAKQIGENSQQNTIARWNEELLVPLAQALSQSKVDVTEMQKGAISILMKIDPEYVPPIEFGGRPSKGIPLYLLALAVIVALIAALFVTGAIQAP